MKSKTKQKGACPGILLMPEGLTFKESKLRSSFLFFFFPFKQLLKIDFSHLNYLPKAIHCKNKTQLCQEGDEF